MRILLTGASGFLGGAIAQHLSADADHEFFRLQRGSRGQPNEINVDLTDPDLARKLPGRMDLIVHAGACVPEKESGAQRDVAMATNAEATLKLLEYSVQAGVKRFVYVSSAAVYGIPLAAGAVGEDVAPRPDNFYALSKLAGELMLEAYTFVHGIETVALRFSYIYGKGMRASGVVSKFAAMARAGASIPLFNSGTDYFDLVHLSDAVRAVASAMQRGSGVYNIGSGRPTSVLELAMALIEVNGSTSRIEKLPATGKYHSKYLDISKAGAGLDWAPQVGLREGLREI
ncbi:MAG: NAD-dependent epimerase/dehydratase [Verrucomicrobia bacterium]|nr:NAD-dependent epimerase/dehydratase [Verrucomicrobiota bacterium]